MDKKVVAQPCADVREDGQPAIAAGVLQQKMNRSFGDSMREVEEDWDVTLSDLGRGDRSWIGTVVDGKVTHPCTVVWDIGVGVRTPFRFNVTSSTTLGTSINIHGGYTLDAEAVGTVGTGWSESSDGHGGNAAPTVGAIKRIRCGDIDPSVDAGMTVILTDLRGSCVTRRVTASDGRETLECHLGIGLVIRTGEFKTPCLGHITEVDAPTASAPNGPEGRSLTGL